MVHTLTIGHIDPAAVERRQTVPTKGLEMEVVQRLLMELGEKDAEGNATLGGYKVRFENAAVSCVWKGTGTNRVVEEFALRMQRETGCVIADVGGYRLVDAGELVGLNGLAAHAAPAASNR